MSGFDYLKERKMEKEFCKQKWEVIWEERRQNHGVWEWLRSRGPRKRRMMKKRKNVCHIGMPYTNLMSHRVGFCFCWLSGNRESTWSFGIQPLRLGKNNSEAESITPAGASQLQARCLWQCHSNRAASWNVPSSGSSGLTAPAPALSSPFCPTV